MSSVGSDPSVGAAEVPTPAPVTDPSVGADVNVPRLSYNDNPDVTHARGRIDDIIKALNVVRNRITPEMLTPELAGLLDDADEAIEKAADIVVKE